jgi:hypothetical protein
VTNVATSPQPVSKNRTVTLTSPLGEH